MTASFMHRSAVQANKNRKHIKKMTEALNHRLGTPGHTDNVVEDLIKDKHAQSDLIDAQHDQIQRLTQMLRGLGHYTPDVGFLDGAA